MYRPTHLKNKSRKELKADIVEALSHSDMSKNDLIDLYVKITCTHDSVITKYITNENNLVVEKTCKRCGNLEIKK